MEPAEKPQKTELKKDTSPAMPPVAAPRTPNRFAGMLARTSHAFTAEYSVYLIALGIALSNLSGLVFIFFSLVVTAMEGGSYGSFSPASMFALWLMVSSLVMLPVAAVLGARVYGEVSANEEYNGRLPKGAAKGFRTFWIIVAALSSLGMLVLAMYAPIAAAIAGSSPANILVSLTIPSLLAIVINAVGVYLVTRCLGERKKSRFILWIVAGLTVLLFGITYIWASNTTSEPYRSPYSSPYDTDTDLYNDPYYRYDLPSDYR